MSKMKTKKSPVSDLKNDVASELAAHLDACLRFGEGDKDHKEVMEILALHGWFHRSKLK